MKITLSGGLCLEIGANGQIHAGWDRLPLIWLENFANDRHY
jgi:hypothetical protein